MEMGILSAIGNTPLVRLSKCFYDIPFQLYAKLESLNPGGSIKDRSSLQILRHGIEKGLIQKETTIVESSSGNMAIGLAQACAYLNLKLICVVDPKINPQTVKILEAYGAILDMVKEPDPKTKEFLAARLSRVKAILRAEKNAYWPNQHANLENPRANHQTMEEILRSLDRRVDFLFVATSTCGTIRGCAEVVRKYDLSTKIIAVDSVSSVIFGPSEGKRLIPGMGAGIRPALYRDDLAHAVVRVTDLDCIKGCRLLLKTEGILAGGSSGGAIMAVHYWHGKIPEGNRVVVLFPDRGERYLDTIYSEAWVQKHFGEIQADVNVVETRQLEVA